MVVMRFFGKAQEAAQAILKAFESPNTLPKPLARMFVRRQDNVPCRKWSWRNQLLVALSGYADARGFRQWQEVGRWVKRGEKSFQILTPVTKRIVEEETSNERLAVLGFKSVAVFGYEQTDGQRLQAHDPEADKWIESLPLVGVAEKWGLSVETFDGQRGCYLGAYRPGKGIALGVKNLATWAHELVHAADDRNGKLKRVGQEWSNEIVAELGGAVLLQILGYENEADLGGCWQYVRSYAIKAEMALVDACGQVLDRTCAAIALILDTAQTIQQPEATAATSAEPSFALNKDGN
jgi:hypothetical protein